MAAHGAVLTAGPSIWLRFWLSFFVISPFVAVIVGPFLVGISWLDVTLLVVGTHIAGMAITIGHHRFFTHKSFKTSRAIQALLAISGSFALEGSLCHWVATHRIHHRHSDKEGDPHSPYAYGHSLAGLTLGFFHAHLGWMFTHGLAPAEIEKETSDLQQDPLLVWIDKLFWLWVIMSLLIPALVGGLVTWSWLGALSGFLWGGLVRVGLVHHITWSINSACHVWGKRDFATTDSSFNNRLFGLLGFGEGWHNNHHFCPWSARHGFYWWQFDLSWCVIKMLQLCRLVWDVRVPEASYLTRHRLSTG